MAAEPTLLIIQMEAVHRAGREILRARKSMSGLRLLAAGWPGRTVVAAPELDAPPPGPSGWAVDAEAVLEHLPSDDPLAAARRVRPDAVLALHHPRQYPLLDEFADRTVLSVENAWEQRLRIALLNSPPRHRARIIAGALRRRREFRRTIARAAGIQCNGYGAFEAYRRLAPRAMIHFDHRVTADVVRASHPAQPSAAPAPLRLGFSGRHTRIKGPDHAIRLVRGLQDRGIDAELTVFGEGDMTPDLRRQAGPGVRFAGTLPFEESWIPAVRSGIDLMVLPSPQGDPAGTYLESIGAGVPVLGYANSALAPLVARHGIGWCVGVGDEGALLEQAAALAADRAAITARARDGLAFMAEHSVEREFARRVEHLRSVADV